MKNSLIDFIFSSQTTCFDVETRVNKILKKAKLKEMLIVSQLRLKISCFPPSELSTVFNSKPFGTIEYQRNSKSSNLD